MTQPKSLLRLSERGSTPEMCPFRDGDGRPCIYSRGHTGGCGIDPEWRRFYNEIDPAEECAKRLREGKSR